MAKSFTVTTVVKNELVAQNTYKMRIACPDVARPFRPGQFCMIRKPGANDPLLGRPFAIYDLWQDESGAVAGVDVMYLVVGKATAGFAELQPGQPIEIWGPLGNGFTVDKSAKHVIMLAGGIGQTPFLTLAKEALSKTECGCNAVPQITLCYGARSKDAFAGLVDFKTLGIEMALTTVDGTEPDGYCCRQGFATDPMKEIFESEPAEDLFVCACGPRPMLIAAQKLMNQYNVRGQMSLETPMACGLGICFTCVAKIQDDSGAWDYKRTCKEGPVFDASRILWE
ncbi:MAG: dihydroorotate dehydrogenase electron transfer subunit [Thermoguttaceae bacterium]|nr:dihydroorotate dehydrogenase electron transfer subunit [Thermoguttaceae bacterium]